MRFTFRTGTAAVFSLMLSAAIGTSAVAQGLGEITVDSALNQPLRAHIELLDVSKLDETQVKVALASDAEYALAQVVRSPNLGQLKFQVEIKKDGTGRILVTSGTDISEPFLDLLVGVSWPNGRTLREYTLLLDLPQNKTQAASVSRVSPAVAGPTSPIPTATADSKQYEVQKGDTLYQIAEQTRPSASVGVQQMMVAIQRANEDSFVNNNVNRIMTGK
ncbi:MAG: FimV/HubP family polar landmark protein, partial [Gammaproteobacteria bacterium]